MAGRYLIYASFLVFAGLLAILYNDYTTGLFLVCFALYPVVAWGELMLHRIFLSCKCCFTAEGSAPAPEKEGADGTGILAVEKGQEFYLEHLIRNRSILPLWHVMIRSTLENRMNGDQYRQERHAAGLWPFRGSLLRFPFTPEHYGVYRLAEKRRYNRIWAEDPFRLIRLRLRLPESGAVFCRPVVKESLESLWLDMQPELGDLLMSIASDSYDQKEIRAFMPGDRRNRIHWKLTEKVGELMVRVMEKEEEPALLLVPVLDGEKPEEDDCCLERLNRMVAVLLSAGVYFDLFIRTEAYGEIRRVDGEASFGAALFELLDTTCPPVPEADDGADSEDAYCPPEQAAKYHFACFVRPDGIVWKQRGGGRL